MKTNPSVEFGIYIHIPYCLQRCRYCDFATYEWQQILPPEDYLKLLLQEMRLRASTLAPRKLSSVYFGGGTPSLVPAEHIVTLLAELANLGFTFTPQTEVTIEINPATIEEAKLEIYLKGGVNRFSVGAQTFNDRLLGLCGRKHNATDTRNTLRLLAQYKLNYSFDLLFALPSQTTDELKTDLNEVLEWAPPHLSTYCLTVPTGHPMATGRPPEDDQILMFEMIEKDLAQVGLNLYEISNFARTGFESKHNGLYWSDDEYLGLGLSSHSYLHQGEWGTRFWNPSTIEAYQSQIEGRIDLPQKQKEQLELHQSLTDFCHIFLRTQRGLTSAALHQKFGEKIATKVLGLCEPLVREELLVRTDAGFALTRSGRILSNLVFEKLTFLEEDVRDLFAHSPLAEH